MEATATHIPYASTGFYSTIVLDYLQQQQALQPFYLHEVSLKGIETAISARRQFTQQRNALAAVLDQQYASLQQSPALARNIGLLRDEHTFVITTAHQPNIFTGPLYFIYKILHTIRLAAYCGEHFPGKHFVPVFYMGSEDADLDELGTITVEGKAYRWQTAQTGAVGRMKVDESFLQLLAELEGQLGVLPHAPAITGLFKKYYVPGNPIQQATLGLVNELFGQYGLVVLVPDQPALKALFRPILEKELLEGFSHQAVAATLAQLEKQYKVQAGGRNLNLFYLLDNRRERIEINGTGENARYQVRELQKSFSRQEILEELELHPERFSPNVILRGVFQETVLPGIAFIGGGGELAYWLELKEVFAAAEVPYPLLVLRNSFLLVEKRWESKLQKLGIAPGDLFKSLHLLMSELVQQHSDQHIGLNGELDGLRQLYSRIEQTAMAVDPSLRQHVSALQTKALQRLEELEKKMLRAAKRRFATEQRQLELVKGALFPHNSLQERVENIAGWYAHYGPGFIDGLLEHSLALEQQFTVLECR